MWVRILPLPHLSGDKLGTKTIRLKNFRVPAWRKRQIRERERRQDLVTSTAVSAMEKVMLQAVGFIMESFQATGAFTAPSLHQMSAVSEDFYRGVIRQAFESAQSEKHSQTGKRRLSKLPLGLPKTMRDMTKVFRDKRYWPKIMKRSEKLTGRLRDSYLEKLRKKFQEISPKLKSGEMSPDEAKEHLMGAWNVSKSRVETIFRTETTTYFSKSQTAFFEGDPEIIGFLFDSVSDKARTNICRSRHGLIYRSGTVELRKNTPALHWNCRSHLLALANTADNRRMLEDPGRDPSKKPVAPLPPNWRK